MCGRVTIPREKMRGQISCAVAVSCDVVDAGAALTLHCKVSCSPPCNLRGHTLLVKDPSGADVASIELTEYDGAANEARIFVEKAPVEAGAHTWWVTCPAVVKEGVSYTEASAAVSFTVTPHATNLVAWDIPSAIAVGATFRVKVGVTCSRACDQAKRSFGIYDHEGVQIAAGRLPGDRWPGTTALYVAEIELEAPAGEGLYTWSVKSPGSGVGVPHAEGSVNFGVRVVRHPEYLVTVETVDRVDQTPLKGAHVVMHPYRAVTDERGIAEMRVAGGAYRLFVSQTRYLTFGLPVEVTADVTARAELDLEPVVERH
jgi:hypothetical protein